jgi:hypothetical protein
MAKSLLGSDTLGWVIDEYFLEEVQELVVEVVIGRDGFLSLNQYGLMDRIQISNVHEVSSLL